MLEKLREKIDDAVGDVLEAGDGARDQDEICDRELALENLRGNDGDDEQLPEFG